MAVAALLVSAAMLLPGDAWQAGGEAKLQKTEAAHMLHLLAEACEECSEEETEGFYKTLPPATGHLFLASPAPGLPIAVPAAASPRVPFFQYKVGLYLALQVLRI